MSVLSGPSVFMEGMTALEEGAEKHDAAAVRASPSHPPRKSKLLLIAFFACLSFLIMILNTLVSFLNDIIRDESIMNKLHEIVMSKSEPNVTGNT